MTEQLPAPLVPASVDLRDFAYMPLEVKRLRDSETSARTRGDEFRCAVLLWCASWHQVPAGSLPDDEVMLATYAGFGRVIREWKRVRDGALRGFVKCSDGRLYHQVVAEKAITAWLAQLEQRWITECSRLKKQAQRRNEKPSLPDRELWISQVCPESITYLSRGHPMDVSEDTPPLSQGQTPPVSRETTSKRSEGKYLNQSSDSSNTVARRANGNGSGQSPGKSNPPTSRQWRGSNQGIIDEGKRRGIEPRVGESMEAFRVRVEQTRPPREAAA
jgi:hypothetical protein